jgi:hypothetical protein
VGHAAKRPIHQNNALFPPVLGNIVSQRIAICLQEKKENKKERNGSFGRRVAFRESNMQKE